MQVLVVGTDIYGKSFPISMYSEELKTINEYLSKEKFICYNENWGQIH